MKNIVAQVEDEGSPVNGGGIEECVDRKVIPPTKREVEMIIKNLKSSRAQGPDGLSSDILKANAPLWADILKVVFEEIIKGGEMPITWKGSVRIPIYKKGC